jgi:quercetin dioxygenase-like cupin family protein
VHVIDGEASVRVAGTDHMVRSGQMILLPANKPHALKALTAFKMLLTMIRI